MTRGHDWSLGLPSRIPGVAWPPLPNPGAALLVCLLHEVDETQWLPPEAIRAGQRRQLAALAAHAAVQSPFIRERLAAAGLPPAALAEPDGLARLPVLTRREVQAAGERLFCVQAPQTHLPIAETRTSGSSGEPVVVRRTAVSQLFWLANTLREHLRHGRDFRQPLAIAAPLRPRSGRDGRSPGASR